MKKTQSSDLSISKRIPSSVNSIENETNAIISSSITELWPENKAKRIARMAQNIILTCSDSVVISSRTHSKAANSSGEIL